MRSWRGTWTSRARVAAAGLVISAAGLILSSGNALAAVGDITEYTVPGAGPGGPPLAGWAPTGIAAGPDGNLWFTLNRSGSCGSVGRVTTLGVVTEFQLPFPCNQPDGIVAGPDGNLWFTEPNNPKVGKVTTSGVFTEYPTPTQTGSLSRGIALGSDSNLWFTEGGGSKVAKVTTAGVFTEYAGPSGDPQFIAAGPDGNLWFTEGTGNKVAKVTTAGVFTEYPVPTASSTPNGIAAGPDGNLWFTENSANKVAKVTTAGSFTEYPVPTAGSLPNGIAAGPDGNLWLTENSANKVARVTTSGVFTEYAIPTASSSPNGIAAGPDGNLWFTEGIGKVAKIVAGAAATPTSFCVSGANAGVPVDCVLYESRAGAPSEVSDVVPIPVPPQFVPTEITVLLENPNLPQNDPKNWSDVVEFIPQAAGSPQSTSVEMLSVGCGNLNDPTDITCFPAAASVNQFVIETQTGTGNDFQDCTPFSVLFQGQTAVNVHACSDSPAVESGDTLPIPEVPLPIMLPLAALGVLVAGYGWRRRTPSRV